MHMLYINYCKLSHELSNSLPKILCHLSCDLLLLRSSIVRNRSSYRSVIKTSTQKSFHRRIYHHPSQFLCLQEKFLQIQGNKFFHLFEFSKTRESDRGGSLSKYLGRARDCKQYRIARLVSRARTIMGRQTLSV